MSHHPYPAQCRPALLPLRDLFPPAFAVVCVLTWIAFVPSQTLGRFLGQNAIKVVSRLMGLLLTVIGVQMLIAGIRGAMAA